MIDTVLFDLDGTLLSMDQDEFIKAYFGLLAQFTAAQGWDQRETMQVVGAGTKAMIKNDGSMTNEERFWQVFTEGTGRTRVSAEEIFLHFYKNDFEKLSSLSQRKEESAGVVRRMRSKGLKVVLATNPLFPRVATAARIRWAGLSAEDFDWITTYENSRFSKPFLDYYREVLAAVGAEPQNCLMVGNDTTEDMCTAELGMQVYLVTDHLIDTQGRGEQAFRHGSLKELGEQIDQLVEAAPFSPGASVLS